MKIRKWVYRKPFYTNNGLWPFGIWFYKWGIAFHWRTIADAHIELEF